MNYSKPLKIRSLLNIIVSDSPVVSEYCLVQIVAITAKMTDIYFTLQIFLDIMSE